MVEREGGRAYLVVTFDLPNQQIVRTEEVVGPFEGEFNEVVVDWQRVFGIVIAKGGEGLGKNRPWTRSSVAEELKSARRIARRDDVGPPKDPPWTRPVPDDAERPPEP